MGYQPVNRWQITDNVPFQKSFDGYLEKYFPNELPTQYSTVVYWYLDPDGKDTLPAVPSDELYGYETPFSVFRQKGAVEAENLVIQENTGGWASTDFWAHESLFESVSGHKIMLWFAARDKPNTLTATFEWNEEGVYDVYVNLVKQEDGGKFAIKINGQTLKSLDFYAPKDNKHTQRVKLGKLQIKPGQQLVEFEWKGGGKLPQAMRMDYLDFKKV